MTVTRPLAITPLTDITTWLRGRGLEIVLLVLGAVLLARFVAWCGRRITERMDATATDEDALVRSEAAKHRGAVAQVLTCISMALIWSVTGVLILQRLGVPVSSLVASAAVLGAALGFGAQQVVRDLLAGLFIVMERQYGYGDLVHISAVGFEGHRHDRGRRPAHHPPAHPHRRRGDRPQRPDRRGHQPVPRLGPGRGRRAAAGRRGRAPGQ